MLIADGVIYLPQNETAPPCGVPQPEVGREISGTVKVNRPWLGDIMHPIIALGIGEVKGSAKISVKSKIDKHQELFVTETYTYL